MADSKTGGGGLPEPVKRPHENGSGASNSALEPSNEEDPPTEVIKSSVAEVLSRHAVQIPANSRNLIADEVTAQVVQIVQHASFFSGPLPPPSLLAEYEAVIPGLARDLVLRAESEQQHRHTWERRALLNDIFMQSGALLLGWLLAAAALVGAIYLYSIELPWAATAVLGLPVLSMVRTIVNARHKPDRGSERNDKAASRPPSGKRGRKSK